ncbi:cytochrome P450 9e2-like [Aphidius gifuensis]|uniref:cytochrome P450 9e2-like n=1 Tax=Aphidius gifuensis TaxID=684658 RepID=UPI001CDB4C7F|nr:cytochrome P450 9e2-like [Aphidius gifuensis]
MFEKTNGDLTYEAVNGLAYLDAVIKETLRCYPIAGFLDRVCSKSFELPPTLPGAKPHRLEPADFIWFPVFAIQRDPIYFYEPEKFYPDRFIEDPKGTLNSPAYMPFGLGPRMCIGNRFALLETKVPLAHLVSKC